MSGWVQRPATAGQKFGAFAKGAQQGHQVASTALQVGAAANAVVPRGRPDLPGPRTAAFFAHRYGMGGRVAGMQGGGVGTEDQMAILRAMHGQGDAIAAHRDGPARIGRFRDMAPPAADSAHAFVDEFASTEQFRQGAQGALRAPWEGRLRRPWDPWGPLG